MRWQGRRESSNVDDRRGIGGPVAVGGGIIGIIALVFNFLMGGNVDVTQITQPQGQSGQVAPADQQADDQRASFVKVVLQETENVWNTLFQQQLGKDYPEPTLVLFRGQVQSGCGGASSASGPFYCPADQQLYIDLSFYEELQTRFRAPGDFSMAYVVAHEVGHHIQTVLGISQKMNQMRQQLSKEEYNKYSVMMELQADFLAGVWAHHTQKMEGIIEPGDIEEALNAANAIGDDRLQREAQGHVVPESFTHGTSAQRMFWFRKGYQTGDINQGDTFNAPDLQ